MILANPNNWFPWVDQVDRPYFIAIDKQNKVYSEFTNFDLAKPVTASQNNWYEQVDKANLKLFIIKGRFGYYWVDLDTGILFCTAQHEVGDNPIITYAIGLQIEDEIITDKNLKYNLKHLKLSDVELMSSASPKVIRGMNCHPKGLYDNKNLLKQNKIPFDASQTSDVVFGWEIKHTLGRITFEGIVSNRVPRFLIQLLYTPSRDVDHQSLASLRLFDIPRQQERHREFFNIQPQRKINKGEKVTWLEKIL